MNVWRMFLGLLTLLGAVLWLPMQRPRQAQ
jgi:hypothetical protein